MLQPRFRRTLQVFCLSLFAFRPGSIQAETKEERNTNQERFLLGIDRLEALQFKYLQGKRVGLLTHPAGVNSRGESTIEVLRLSQKVNLVALYGPEHGIYGDEKANVPVRNRIDEKTKLPVYSLYGKFRKPTIGKII